MLRAGMLQRMKLYGVIKFLFSGKEESHSQYCQQGKAQISSGGNRARMTRGIWRSSSCIVGGHVCNRRQRRINHVFGVKRWAWGTSWWLCFLVCHGD